jgi:anti-sigma B factor antagonist
MQITEHDRNGITVFALQGRVDSAGASDLDLALQAAIGAGHFNLVLDMAGVSYINSAGLRTLADILTKSRTQGGDLRLVALTPKVERVFKIIGFDKFFTLFDSVDAACAF